MFWFVLCLGFVWASVYNILPVSFPAFKGVFEATTEHGEESAPFLRGRADVYQLGWFIERLGFGRLLLPPRC